MQLLFGFIAPTIVMKIGMTAESAQTLARREEEHHSEDSPSLESIVVANAHGMSRGTMHSINDPVLSLPNFSLSCLCDLLLFVICATVIDTA